MSRKIVTCSVCGRRWFADDTDNVYHEIRVIHGPGMPPEGFVYKEQYYCKDHAPWGEAKKQQKHYNS